MGKYSRDEDVVPIKDFIKGYKLNFQISMKFWLSFLLLFFLLVWAQQELSLVSSGIRILGIFLIPMLIFLTAINLWAFPILSRYEIGLKNLWLLSWVSFFQRWYQSLLLIIIIGVAVFFFYQLPAVLMVFGPGLIPFLIMFTLKKSLNKLKPSD
jgi:uncharacterized membrane protein YesL